MGERPDLSAVHWGRTCEPVKVSPSWPLCLAVTLSGSGPCCDAAQQTKSSASDYWRNLESPLPDLTCVTLSDRNLRCVYLTFFPAPPLSGYCCCCCLRCSSGCCARPGVLSVSGTGMKIRPLRGQQGSTYCSGCCRHTAGPHQTKVDPTSPQRKTSCWMVYY